MFLIPIVLIILIVWFFVYLFRPNAEKVIHYNHNAASKTPLEILNERYAKGEIGEEEYQKIKRNLQN